MKQNSETKKNIDEILNGFDGIRRACPKPYFFTRVMARWDRKDSGWEKVAAFISRPAFAVAIIALFLFINFFILYNSSSHATPVAQDESSIAAENEYGLSVSSLYDINPEQNDIAQK